MANFQAQVEGITGLSIGTTPTTTELTQFLVDGVNDVTHRIISLRPQDAGVFTEVTGEDTSNGINLNGARIISVIRESGINDDWRECRQVSPSMQGRVKDVNSLNYASKYNPVWCILDDGSINVFPVPKTGEAVKVYYINITPQNGSSSALAYNSDDISAFPADKIRLVIMYAGMKSLDVSLAAKAQELPSDLTALVLDTITETLPTFSAPDAFVMPIAPAGVDVDFSSVTSISTFVAPVLSLPDAPTISDMNLPDTPIIPVLTGSGSSGGNSYTLPTSGVPTFVQPVVSPDYDDANNWINIEEDEELLAARMQVINARIGQYNADIQNARVKFEQENVEYQAKLQKSEKDATLGSGDDQNIIAKFRAEVEKYSQEVAKEVQRYKSEEIEVATAHWIQELQSKISKYQADIQNEQARIALSIQTFQAEVDQVMKEYNAETGYDVSVYQANIQAATSKYQAGINKNQITFEKGIEKFTGDVQATRASNESKVGAHNADIQNYMAKVAKVKSDYEWMTTRLMKLQQEYDGAFLLMQPQSKQQSQGGK